MQPPTCYGLRVRTPADAHVIFHAISCNILKKVTRRLDTDERRAISSGCIYVWEERGQNTEATGLGIERWTDSIQWGPSRVRDEFLFYQERRPTQVDVDMTSDSDATTPELRSGVYRPSLFKQTYSVFVQTDRGQRKWHLIAYFTHETYDELYTIDNHPSYPELTSLRVPSGMYRSARSSKTRVTTRISNSNIRRSSSHTPPAPSHRIEPLNSIHDRTFASLPNRKARPEATLAPLVYLSLKRPPARPIVDQMAINSLPVDATLLGDFASSHNVRPGISRLSFY